MSSEIKYKSDILKSRERLQTRIFQIAEDASITVANEIAEGIRSKNSTGKPFVLGLSAGSNFQRIYAELIAMHKSGSLSFKDVIVFGLEEYLPMRPEQLQSLNYRLRCEFLDHVDLLPANVHLLDGTVAAAAAQAHCDAFEASIAAAGGLDYMLITVGGDGHVGFNLAGAGAHTRTRTLFISKGMRIACASEFFGVKNVPLESLSMGLGTILSARRVAVMEFGEGRAGIVRRLVEEPATDAVTITRLQAHPAATLFCDAAAAATLTEMAAPWLISGADSAAVVEYTPEMTRKAVIWLALRTGRSVLRLVDDDYREHQLSQLINAHRGNAHEVNLAVYHHLHRGMTGWPGGRTAEPPLLREPLAHPTIPGEKTNYDVSIVPKKRILVFSPHPDDDVISMGGTIIRLCDQGHEVHTVYMTSGNIAVFDDDAVRFCGYTVDQLTALGITGPALEESRALLARVKADALAKCAENSFMDTADLLTVKRLIRQQEALSASRLCGVTEEHVHFLNLPFYQTGTVEKSPITDRDVEIVLALLREQKPQQIYAAGDLSDPHGTHRMCLKALLKAIDTIRSEDPEGWIKDCIIWLYRGAWQEWEPEKVQMTVPMSPDELYRKRLAIYRHQSQKDPMPFPGTDPREFWQRSEARNKTTAELFVKLGLPQFEALETFVRYDPDAPECKALLN